MAVAKLPMIVSPYQGPHRRGTAAGIVTVARSMEAAGEILHGSLFPVQPWLDIPDLGFGSARVHEWRCCGRAARRRQAGRPRLGAARRLRSRRSWTWSTRSTSASRQTARPWLPIRAMRRAAARRPITSACCRRCSMPAPTARPAQAYLTLCDAEAAKVCAAAGVGTTLTLDVGHKVSRNGRHSRSHPVPRAHHQRRQLRHARTPAREESGWSRV